MRNTASVDSLSVAVPKVFKFLSTSSRSVCRVPRMIPLSLSACTIVNTKMKGITTQEGRETLNKFKMEAANEVGVNLKQGYNGDLTAREVGSVGGQMVKIISPEQQWIFTRNSVRNTGHCIKITYAVRLSV